MPRHPGQPARAPLPPLADLRPRAQDNAVEHQGLIGEQPTAEPALVDARVPRVESALSLLESGGLD